MRWLAVFRFCWSSYLSHVTDLSKRLLGHWRIREKGSKQSRKGLRTGFYLYVEWLLLDISSIVLYFLAFIAYIYDTWVFCGVNKFQAMQTEVFCHLKTFDDAARLLRLLKYSRSIGEFYRRTQNNSKWLCLLCRYGALGANTKIGWPGYLNKEMTRFHLPYAKT